MKKVILTLPEKDVPVIEDLLKEGLNIHELQARFEKPHEQPERVRFSFYVFDDQLDKMIKRLRESLDFDDRYTFIEVLAPEFMVSSVLDKLEEERKDEKPTLERPTVEDLIESVEQYTHLEYGKIILSIIAGLVALIGLFLDNVVIIIGAMLLSPILGPIYAFAISTAIGNVKDALRSALIIGVMLGVIVLFSFFATIILSLFFELPITDEIESRLSVNPIFILMAILLGFAAIFALSKGIAEGIAGVAIAAAVIPPTVTIGIAAAIVPWQAIDALVLTLQNVIGLVAGSIIAVAALQVGPRNLYDHYRAKKLIIGVGWLLVVLILFILVLSLLI